MNVFITGANRGLGLEFVRQYSRDGDTVFACCRRASSDLEQLTRDNARVKLCVADVTDESRLAALAAELTGPIDVLVNNAGINLGRAAESVDANWEQMFRVNAIAPYRVSRVFHSHLREARSPKVITMSSGMASNARHNGSSYAYRASKAAVNNVMGGLAVEWSKDNIIVALVSPGWVQTDMGGPNALLSPQDSVSAMRQTIAKLGMKHSGRFLDYLGLDLPW